jgi:hypothetical protein
LSSMPEALAELLRQAVLENPKERNGHERKD